MTSRVLHESRCGPWSWDAEKVQTDGRIQSRDRLLGAFCVVAGGINDIQDGGTMYVCATLLIYPVTGS